MSPRHLWVYILLPASLAEDSNHACVVPHARLSGEGDERSSLARSGPTLVLDLVPPTASWFSNQNLMSERGSSKESQGHRHKKRT